MAARRLLIVMLILLGVCSVIAVILPTPETRDQGAPQPSATGTADPAPSEPEPAMPTVRESVRLDRRGRPVELEAEPGQRLVITVAAKRSSEVEIEELGRAGFADPYSPAVFDLILPEEPGRYRIGPPQQRPVAVIATS